MYLVKYIYVFEYLCALFLSSIENTNTMLFTDVT